MEFKFIQDFAQINPLQWQRLWDSRYPFIQPEFLLALEQSGATTAASGWQPHHATLWQGPELVAAMPLYIKSHSYGEYVFDWAWADAYQQAGGNYYPKWLNAIPFTPCSGPRLKAKSAEAYETLWQQVLEQSHNQASGIHSLFSLAENADRPMPPQLKPRIGCQFHWFNQGYDNFEAFLQTFSSRKRKNLLKERKKVQQQALSISHKTGQQITTEDMAHFIECYQDTYLQKSGHTGYLPPTFFQLIQKTFANNTLLVQATHEDKPVAAALYFYDDQTLYGRYWGALDFNDCLHYELCYYQGIEFAIANKLQRFDAGAQGEHKIARGFTPVLTQSHHLMHHPQFQQAIEHFLQEERPHIVQYCRSARALQPFKEGVIGPSEDQLLSKN